MLTQKMKAVAWWLGLTDVVRAKYKLKYYKDSFGIEPNNEINLTGHAIEIIYNENTTHQVRNLDSDYVMERELRSYMIEAVNMGMSLRQDQLNGHSDESGVDKLDKWLKFHNILS